MAVEVRELRREDIAGLKAAMGQGGSDAGALPSELMEEHRVNHLSRADLAAVDGERILGAVMAQQDRGDRTLLWVWHDSSAQPETVRYLVDKALAKAQGLRLHHCRIRFCGQDREFWHEVRWPAVVPAEQQAVGADQ